MLQNITHIVSHGVHLAKSEPFTVLQDYLIISTVDTYEPYTFKYPNSLLTIPIAHIKTTVSGRLSSRPNLANRCEDIS